MLCAALVAGCQAQDERAPSPADSGSPALPQLPAADPPLDREALIMAAHQAASAAAIGEEDGGAQRNLDGKRFELRLRFGCPSENAAQATTRRRALDEERRVVRLEVGPEIDRDASLVEQTVGSEFEAVEGFWIRSPWLLRAACPGRPSTSAPQEDAPAAGPGRSAISSPLEPGSTEEPAPRLGIAQFFTATDARTHRRDRRAYQVAESLSEGEAPSSAGYDLIIEGRLQSLPGGRVIACRANGAQQPTCIISASFEQVSLERADTGELLAEWPAG
jgi:hypothetical protein